MKIHFKCSCGAEADFESSQLEPSEPDAQVRVFHVEVVADRWSDRHRPCQAAVMAKMQLETEMGRERLKTMARVAAAAEGLAQSVSGKDDEEDAT